ISCINAGDACMTKPSKVREPVQVYLDRADRSLLEEVAERTGLSRAEILRRGLRRVAGELLKEMAPGTAFEQLVGALGDDPSLPADLAERHDAYLYGDRNDDTGSRAD
ncbi:MAG: CopG family transcriptional regulator, partial [Gemmatimonadota bacterium]